AANVGGGITSATTNPNFGQGGAQFGSGGAGGNVGLAGVTTTGAGGAAGAMGTVQLSGSSVHIQKSIGNTTLGAPFGTSFFTSSIYASDSIVGGNTTISATSPGSGNISITGALAAVNGTVNINSPTTIGLKGIDNTFNSNITITSTQAFNGNSSFAN